LSDFSITISFRLQQFTEPKPVSRRRRGRRRRRMDIFKMLIEKSAKGALG
jgi:hypothetical protein